ncbi:MAG TPA: allantoate amidohydrolase [Chloroflexia bacterium]|nr:allantoate amidohydrolase [Chloroflexia bacterium]
MPNQHPLRNTHYAIRVMQRADILGSISEEPDRLTRRFATPAMRQANELAAGWMREAGMSVRQDNIGNVIGRYEEWGTRGGGLGIRDQELGNEQSQPLAPHTSPLVPHTSPLAPTLIMGSHLDTVRDAGKYDGPLGVLVAIACVERLHELGERLPFAIEVVAFADEEGLRYHTAYLGSKVLAGSFDPMHLELTDEDGVTISEAIRAFGGNPSALAHDNHSREDLLGYCEVHIEQGPVLEAEGLPVGVVSAISGQTRLTVLFKGEAGHAGTVPMRLRRDALCAAAEFVLAVEGLAREREGLVATVGQASVEPGASNVIPGHVEMSLDVRHMDDTIREQACGQLREQAEQICARRQVILNWQHLQSSPSVRCASHLTAILTQAIETAGYTPRYLPSGAGHDAVPMSGLTDVAMLFVRCKGGVSHNPAESVAVEDVAVAIEVMGEFLDMLAREQAQA